MLQPVDLHLEARIRRPMDFAATIPLSGHHGLVAPTLKQGPNNNLPVALLGLRRRRRTVHRSIGSQILLVLGLLRIEVGTCTRAQIPSLDSGKLGGRLKLEMRSADHVCFRLPLMTYTVERADFDDSDIGQR